MAGYFKKKTKARLCLLKPKTLNPKTFVALELNGAGESLAKRPICRNNVRKKPGFSVGGGDLKG